MRSQTTRWALATWLLLVVGLPGAAFAQGTERISGIVESIERDQVTLVGGGTFVLMAETNVSVSRPATSADLQPGHYVAVTAVRLLDGGLGASIVSVFPEFQRGVGEGQFPMEGDNLMTNATINDAMIDMVAGAELTVSYLGQTETVRLTETTRVVLRTVGSRADLRPGANVSANLLDGVARTISIQ